MLSSWDDALEEGIELLGRHRAGGRRLIETKAYLEFMRDELPKLYQRWHRRRQGMFPAAGQDIPRE